MNGGGGAKKASAASRTRVGKYEIGKTLGEGSFAKVKYARDIHTNNSFAIKIIPRDLVLRNELAEQVTFHYYYSVSLFVCCDYYNLIIID